MPEKDDYTMEDYFKEQKMDSGKKIKPRDTTNPYSNDFDDLAREYSRK